jgi:hypothetical protein
MRSESRFTWEYERDLGHLTIWGDCHQLSFLSMNAHYPGKGLSLSQLTFALNEELGRTAYSPSYVVKYHLIHEILSNNIRFPLQLHL